MNLLVALTKSCDIYPPAALNLNNLLIADLSQLCTQQEPDDLRAHRCAAPLASV